MAMRVQGLRDAWSRYRRQRISRQGTPSGVLLISSGGLGDTVLLSHVVERFADLAGDNETVSIILRTDGAKTSFLFPDGIEVQKIDYGRLRRDQSYRDDTAAAFYAANYRLVVSLDYLRHPYLDEFLMLAADGEQTLAMTAKPWPKYASDLAANAARIDRAFESGPPVYDKLKRWVDFANWANETNLPVPKTVLPSTAVGDRTNTVFIQAFSAVEQKQPLPTQFVAILAALPDDCDIRFTGAPGEDAKNPDYQPLFDDPRVTYDDSTFDAILPKLRTARLVISVDTAFLHLSIAAGAPTLGLLSAAYIDEIVPYTPEATPENVRFVYHDMPCRSCLGDCSLPAEDSRYPCIARLPSESVTAALKDML